MRYASLLLLLFLFAPLNSEGGEISLVKPHMKEKCSVCGMFVSKHPDWIAQVIFRDGSYASFDGAKDMFKYYLNMKKYNPAKGVKDVRAVHVTDYYTLTIIDGLNAFYVSGSDVYGPMGKELIAFEKESDASVFAKDHGGKRPLRFREITPVILKALE